MSARAKTACTLVILGCLVLLASAVLHCVGGYTAGFPALRASNLDPRLQAAFRIVFLSLAWHWVVTAAVVLLAGLTQTRLRKPLVLFCGLALLLEAAAGAGVMGFFIGNEILGTAALLLVCGGLLFDRPGVRE